MNDCGETSSRRFKSFLFVDGGHLQDRTSALENAISKVSPTKTHDANILQK
jgi:hypothetical protein